MEKSIIESLIVIFIICLDDLVYQDDRANFFN